MPTERHRKEKPGRDPEPAEPDYTFDEAAALTGLTPGTVQTYLRKYKRGDRVTPAEVAALSDRRHTGKRPRWTPDETRLVLDPSLSPAEVAKRTGRPVEDVRLKRYNERKAGRMPATPLPGYSIPEAALLLGVSPSRVYQLVKTMGWTLTHFPRRLTQHQVDQLRNRNTPPGRDPSR